jgi:hypothetical protein
VLIRQVQSLAFLPWLAANRVAEHGLRDRKMQRIYEEYAGAEY